MYLHLLVFFCQSVCKVVIIQVWVKHGLLVLCTLRLFFFFMSKDI